MTQERAHASGVRSQDSGSQAVSPTAFQPGRFTRWATLALALGLTAGLMGELQRDEPVSLARDPQQRGLSAVSRPWVPSDVRQRGLEPSFAREQVGVEPFPRDAGVAASASGEARAKVSPAAPPCAGALRLVGSVVNAKRPERSYAALRVNGGTRVTHVGRRVGERTLIAVRPGRAYLREPDGAYCQVLLAPAVAPPPGPSPGKTAPGASTKRARKAPLLSEAELQSGIRKDGPDTYTVARTLLSKALGSPAALQRSGRFRQHSEDGRAAGLKLISMRKDSPLKALGLEKGDVIRKLNGQDLSSPDGALQAYGLLKTEGRFSLAISRGGAPRTLTYNVE